MLDKGQIALIKRLIQDDAWDVLVGIALADYLEKINLKSVVGNTEFEELRDLHKKQGGIEHLTEFFSHIEKLNFD